MDLKNYFHLISALLLFSFNSRTRADETTVKVANAINTFGLKFYSELTKDSQLKNSNIFCSGFSLTTVLNMLLSGAGTDTATEMRQALGYQSAGLTQTQTETAYHQILEQQKNHREGYDLNVANSIWIQKGFNVLPKYKNTVEKTYFAEENEVDFSTPAGTNQINDWVKQETKGKIPKLFDKLDASTSLVLANAMYFKGSWKVEFDKKLTADYPFMFSNGNKKIEMMNDVRFFNYTESKDFGAQILELPYKGDEVSMILVLPKAVNGLTNFEQNLNFNKLNTVLKQLESVKVHVKIPKFNSSSNLQLNGVLPSLGISKVFTESADLSGIDGKRDLYVSTAVQKAIIEVNEEGTVAAAATGIGASITSVGGPKPKEIFFIADHPFFYFILHKPSGIILFTGRFTKPE